MSQCQCLLVTAFILFHLIVVLDAGKRKSTYYEIAQCNELCESEEKKGSYKWGKCLKYYVEDIVETEDKRYGKYGPRYYCRGTYMNVCFCKNDRCKLYKLRRSPIDLSLSRCRFSETLLRAKNHTCSSTPCKTKLKCSEKGTDTCKTGNGSCTCVCKKGFTGELCDKCDQSFCQNEGTCTINRNGNPICNCISGTTGIKCEKKICSPKYPQEACKSLKEGETCNVPQHELKLQKSFFINVRRNKTHDATPELCDKCDSYCHNGGTCAADQHGVPSCICPQGTAGEKCETTQKYKASSTVKSDASTDSTATTLSISAEVATTTPIKVCSLECKNGGACVMEDLNQPCACPPGFTGLSCEFDPCSALPCINNGSCEINQTGYVCHCPSDYGGRNCETHKLCSPCEKRGFSAAAVAGSFCTRYKRGVEILNCTSGSFFDKERCECVPGSIAAACEC